MSASGTDGPHVVATSQDRLISQQFVVKAKDGADLRWAKARLYVAGEPTLTFLSAEFPNCKRKPHFDVGIEAVYVTS